jgi:hypothetical protein
MLIQGVVVVGFSGQSAGVEVTTVEVPPPAAVKEAMAGLKV